MKKPQADFLTCKAYYGHEPDEENRRYVKFQKGKLFYFGLVDEDEKLLLRGKATKTTADRETRIKTVDRYLEIPESYSILRKGESYFVALSSKNHQPIAISCKLGSKKKATALLQQLSGQEVNEAEADEPAKKKKKKSGKSNSFLTCAKHKGHERSTELPQVSFFTYNEKRYCFSVHNPDGFVLLRSRRYKSEEDRAAGFDLVRLMMADEDRWEKVKNKKYAFLKLKDTNGKTIGKSCRFKDADFDQAWLVGAAGLLTATANAGTIEEEVLPVVKEEVGSTDEVSIVDEAQEDSITTDASNIGTGVLAAAGAGALLVNGEAEADIEAEVQVEESAAVVKEAAVAPKTTIYEDERSGCNWWWLLLLLPLLLLLFLLRSCMGGDAAVTPAPIVKEVVVAPAPTVEPVVVAESFKLEPIFFGFDSYELTSEAKAKLDDLVKILEDNPKFNTQLYAHTDSKGSKVYNENLSKNRASNALAYLVEKGVDPRRVSFSFYGEDSPVAKNQLDSGADTEEGRKYNRRVELAIVDGDEVVKSETIEVPVSLKE